MSRSTEVSRRLDVVVAAFAVVFAVPAWGQWSNYNNNDDRVFRLAGNAFKAQDPENPTNDVIQINTAVSPFYGTISRRLNVKIDTLDNQLEFKAYFQNRSCGGGSPRIQLAIDLDGDGQADGNAFGYTDPPFVGCPPNTWEYYDLTDALPRWDLSQLAAAGLPALTCPPLPAALCPFNTHSGYVPWVVFEAALMTLFPNHRVCSAAVVDDSGWMPGAAGIAYYDLISLGGATFNDHSDLTGRGTIPGCRRDDDDKCE